jgi:hypothetical protein
MSDRRATGRPSRASLLFAICIAALAALLLPKLWFADTALYQQQLTPRVLLAITCIAKLCFLLTATVMAWRVAGGFGRANSAGRNWRLMALGFGSSFVAQSILGRYQVLLGEHSPYPSAADPFFVVGMILLAVALLGFLGTYVRSDLPLTNRREVLLLCVAAVLPLIGLAAWLLRPVLASPAPLVEQALNVTYPVLDCLLLVPTLVLARVTSRLRGGQLHRVWTVLLAGFLCTAAGDVAFAYFSTLGVQRLDPLVDFLYGASYALWAWGATLQLQVVGAGETAGSATAS